MDYQLNLHFMHFQVSKHTADVAQPKLDPTVKERRRR
jgi:hypothetical protein